jgi:hypothetical protein
MKMANRHIKKLSVRNMSGMVAGGNSALTSEYSRYPELFKLYHYDCVAVALEV